jgi:hypothetical protein
MKMKSIYSHTWLGLFWFDLPLGLLLMWVYQRIVKKHLIVHLPAPLNQRFTAFESPQHESYSLRSLLVIMWSVLIGAASHLCWDGFTHADGCFIPLIPGLSASIQLGTHHFLVYKLLQHVSTLLGLIAIATVIYYLPQESLAKVRNIVPYWIQVSLVAIGLVSGRLATGLSFHQYGDVLVTAIAGGLWGLIVASLASKYKGSPNHSKEGVVKGFLFIDSNKLGSVDLKITDEAMGVIGGMLDPLPEYNQYRKQIQRLYDQKGIANVEDFNFSIVLEGGGKLEGAGGIGVTDSRDHPDEIYVESAGIKAEILVMIQAGGSS